MKGKQKLKNARGITLVALVVTIIVLVILAGVSITAVLSQNGVIGESKEAKEKTLNAEVHEQEKMNAVVDYIQNNSKGSGNNSSKELIKKNESYVGYYADIDGDKTVDGVIYADLAVGGSGTWGASDTYSYEAISETKDYYVSQANYEGSFGTNDVLTAVNGEGVDRFYVMALEDFNEGTVYCWYDAAYDSGISDYYISISDDETLTSDGFGSGKTNTETMIEKWNSSAYGTQNDHIARLDMWGVIQDKVNEGWFVPSRDEWTAFAYNLEITSSNYSSFGLPNYCWSSSIWPLKQAFVPAFVNALMLNYGFQLCWCVRLSTTF